MARPIRIANISGFLGDRRTAAAEQLHGGPVDVLAGDYLAELTMAILARQRMKDPSAGYARQFLDQLEDVLVEVADRGVKVVANAGGLAPERLADAVAAMAERLGVTIRVAAVTGDDLMPRLDELAAAGHDLGHPGRPIRPIAANAYLGGWAIASALDAGADVVVTGRVSDASLTVGPAAWWHGWRRDDWDALAGAVVAGHVIECGAQATGGNYSFFAEIPGLEHPGFPIAEVAADGSAVVTKHPGTGGAVTIGTVTAQLLYEVGAPRYLNPDVVARLDTVELSDDGPDRVRLSGVRGEPAPATTKVACIGVEGFTNAVTFVLPGLDIDAKADLVERSLWGALGGRERFARVETRLVRTDRDDPPINEAAFATLTVAVVDPDERKVGREFSGAAIELALASYPGFTLTAPPRGARPAVAYWAAAVPVPDAAVHMDAREWTVAGGSVTSPADDIEDQAVEPVAEWEDTVTVRAPIGRIVGARSGDKGGDANLGVWARSDEAYRWLVWFLDIDRLRSLIPEARELEIERHVLPRLRAVNFVLHGLLGEGVASSLRADPQAKTLAEYLRAKLVDIPERLLAV